MTSSLPCRCLMIAALLLAWLCAPALAADSLVLDQYPSTMALGQHTAYLREGASALTLEGARAAWQEGRFTSADDSILSFGIGSRPVWVRLAVVNGSEKTETRRLLIENSWLDYLDIHVLENGRLLRHVRLGDTVPQGVRPIAGRFFAVDHGFAPGSSELYLRIETPDPIVLPIFLLTPGEAAQRQLSQGYSYGFIYGYLIALMVYNLVLYFNLRHRVCLFYGAFLAAFLVMNMAYTGHGFAWLWPHQVLLQQWINPALMVLFGVSGLAFAKAFLDTANSQPHVHRAMSVIAGLYVLLQAMVMLVSGSQRDAVQVAFIFVTVFSALMPLLGLLALRRGQAYAGYFLMATLASMGGTLVTALAVWGFIPYSDWSFRAVEIGMLVDATVLALALGQQFRNLRSEQRLLAQRINRDELTNLPSRRAFLHRALPLWQAARSEGRPLTLIMVDIDHFKVINDVHGHGAGDGVLLALVQQLNSLARQEDLLCRWGGEEFLLLLPDTGLDAATALAERLRKEVAELPLQMNGRDLAFTVSLGVVEQTRQASLDHLITDADNCLYRSKRQGRNRISVDPDEAGLGVPQPA